MKTMFSEIHLDANDEDAAWIALLNDWAHAEANAPVAPAPAPVTPPSHRRDNHRGNRRGSRRGSRASSANAPVLAHSSAPRAANAFILYRRHHAPVLRTAWPHLSNTDASRVLGAQWHSESAEIKAYFRHLAKEISRFNRECLYVVA